MIPLEFNSTGMLGATNHSIAVYSNDPDRPISVLVVEGVVWRHVEVHPSMALIQMPPNGGQKFSTSLRIVNQMKEPITLSDPSCDLPGATVVVNEINPGRDFELALKVPDDQKAIPGALFFITAKTSLPSQPEINIQVAFANQLTLPPESK